MKLDREATKKFGIKVMRIEKVEKSRGKKESARDREILKSDSEGSEKSFRDE